MNTPQFRKLILQWFDAHGRKHFPWQQNKTPYRVWISEIMLQQTQVNTVIPYYEKFMQRFPDVLTLANAHEDEVLHSWAGLGYYSRARNLHRAAKMILNEFAGQFPDNFEGLLKLPGIGRSTAGAILSIAYNQAAAILDGNVKRVLARFHGITQPINEKNIENQLWALAESYLDVKRMADYTQAMMDLGATLCTRSKPDCHPCPLIKHCSAHQQNITELIPQKKSTKKIPTRSATFLIFKYQDNILLQKRPSTGIWGGLWSFPEIAGEIDKKNIHAYCKENFNIKAVNLQTLTSFRHTFSHYHLDIYPVVLTIKRLSDKFSNMEAAKQIWYNPSKASTMGLPKPIQIILEELR